MITALAVSKIFGHSGKLGEGSTDSNVPMNAGIPAITIGGGGLGTGAHALNEAFDTKDSVARYAEGAVAGSGSGAIED